MSILVHSCMASDSGSRVTVPIVNDKGLFISEENTRQFQSFQHVFRCSVDPVLLENIQYDPKKTIAYATSHVYKYADQATIAFICNIRFCSKGSPECTAATVSATNQNFGRFLLMNIFVSVCQQMFFSKGKTTVYLVLLTKIAVGELKSNFVIS